MQVQVGAQAKHTSTMGQFTTDKRGANADLRAKALKINHITRHIFLCCDQTKSGSKCCSAEEGMVLWNYLKKRTKKSLEFVVPDASWFWCQIRNKLISWCF